MKYRNVKTGTIYTSFKLLGYTNRGHELAEVTTARTPQSYIINADSAEMVND